MDLWTRFRGEEGPESLELQLAEEIDLDDCLVIEETEELQVEEHPQERREEKAA